jgi:hypothetical protein
MKKIILTTFLVVIIFSCCTRKTTDDSVVGTIVGCTKCFNNEIDDYSLGIYIITDTKDSLLTYSIPFSSVGLDPESYSHGDYLVDGPVISFSYRVAQENEVVDIFCPMDPRAPPFPYGSTSFLQIIITDYQIIK